MGLLKSVYIIESLRAKEFYDHCLDGAAANEMLKLLDVRSQYRVALDRKHLEKAISDAVRGDFEVIHLSAHGDRAGVELTDGDEISWEELAEMLRPAAGPKKSLVMATCKGGDKKLAKALRKSGVLFGYVFGSTAKTVTFSDSCLAWSILYNRLVDHGFKRGALIPTLTAINAAIEGDFVYRRWTGKRYRYFP